MNESLQEVKLLYKGLDWYVSVGGVFYNPKHRPYTDCLYELALACRDKSEQLDRIKKECEQWMLKATSISYANEIATLESELSSLQHKLDKLADENKILKEKAFMYDELCR